MDGLRVSQLARRSGVPATTLRYYEQQGLLPARRTGAGYRSYDESALDRLGFIATAKRLGLTLAEIRALLLPWEHGGCRDVRAELAPLLAARVDETRERVAELERFGRELDAARAHLATIDRDGPCDRSCSFLRMPVTPTVPPIACSLGGAERAERVGRWRAALAAVVARRPVAGGLRVELDRDRADVAEIAHLAAAEARCCAFLDLRLCFDPGPALEVRAPVDAAEVVVELFGTPDR